MTNIPEFAPGCYGSALAFKESEGVCLACVFRSQCQPLHEANLAALREELGVPNVVKRGRPKVVDEAREALFARDPGALSLPKKVQDLIARIDRGNFEVKSHFARGENPFAGKIPFLAVATEVLLKFSRPVDVPVLTAAFVMKLNWQEDTAKAHARIMLSAFQHLGFIEQQDDGYVAKRDHYVG